MNVRQRIADFVSRAFLLQINRKVNKVLGDGNCLFRALSEQTTGTSGKHAELRKLLLAFEEMNPQIFQPLVATLDPPTKLANHISQNFTWGTTVEIFAAATMFGVVINEATDSLVPGVPRWMRFSPRECNTMRSADNMIQGMYNGSRFSTHANATMIVSLQWTANYFLNPLFLKLTHTLFYHSVAYVLGMYVILPRYYSIILMQSYLPSCCIHRIPLCPPVQILGPIARAGHPARVYTYVRVYV